MSAYVGSSENLKDLKVSRLMYLDLRQGEVLAYAYVGQNQNLQDLKKGPRDTTSLNQKSEITQWWSPYVVPPGGKWAPCTLTPTVVAMYMYVHVYGDSSQGFLSEFESPFSVGNHYCELLAHTCD